MNRKNANNGICDASGKPDASYMYSAKRGNNYEDLPLAPKGFNGRKRAKRHLYRDLRKENL